MKYRLLLTLPSLALISISTAENIEEDPFVDNPLSPKVFTTTSDLKFVATREQIVEDVERYSKASISPNFNRYFKKPTKVWWAQGGYFASFDAGEFGAGLFHVSPKGDKWIKVFDGHVQHFHSYGGNTYLAVGGLAHLDMISGHATLIQLDAQGNWQSREVFNTSEGVPKIVGSVIDDSFYQHHIVIGISYPKGDKSLFTIPSSGIPTYIGQQVN